jgi:hypothetical protein
VGRFKITNDTADIDCRVKIAENDEAAGTIIRQKGAKKFLVTDGSNTGGCVLSDLADGDLENGTMTVCIVHNDKEVRLEYLSNKYGVDFKGNRYILTVSESPVLDNCEPAILKKSADKSKKSSTPKTAKKKAVVKTKSQPVKKEEKVAVVKAEVKPPKDKEVVPEVPVAKVETPKIKEVVPNDKKETKPVEKVATVKTSED